MSWLRLHVAFELGRRDEAEEDAQLVELVELGAETELELDEEPDRRPIGFG